MRTNAPFVTWNRGLISPKSLGRVDVDRTRLSAEVYTNFLPFTQGAMTIRPGTKYVGSSLNDTGAYFIEFVAATDDTALLELTDSVMRIWLGDDSHNLALLKRVSVGTTVNLSDTGWSDTSTGGTITLGSASDVIPVMTDYTTDGVTVSASSELTSAYERIWFAADGNLINEWQDTGNGSALPSWWNVDFGVGNEQGITGYSLRAGEDGSEPPSAPQSWRLLAGAYDTGTYATDTGKWNLVDERSAQTGWAISEKRTFERLDTDTGTIENQRHWRFYFTETATAGIPLVIAEVELFTELTQNQIQNIGQTKTLNALAIGSLARTEKKVVVSDTGTEHSLAIVISNGPITIRVGSSQRDDDYIHETNLGSGYHNLAFTPNGDFWITLQNNKTINKTIQSLSISDTGTVEINAPWSNSDLNYIRNEQSADVVYVACDGVKQYKIERRGVGRSWSIVEYQPNDGPFFPTSSSSAKLTPGNYSGNTTIESDISFFRSSHVGTLIRIFHEGQDGKWILGNDGAKTDAVKVSGISDTGTETGTSERTIKFAVSGNWGGTITIERSIDGEDIGFKAISTSIGTPTDTGTFTKTINDQDDNLDVWYRARITSYTSGAANVNISYAGGGKTGIARVIDYNSNTSVDVEVIKDFSDTGPSDNWQEGYWSDAQSYPSCVALHGGRLCFANGGNLFMSVSDAYESFDDKVEGDSAPLVKTLGSGPVNNVHFLLSALRLVVGTSGAELAARSSSLDEPITPSTANIRTFSTQGSANLRALLLDTKALFVQRSGQRVFVSGFGLEGENLGDYASQELTLLVPDLLNAGIVSIALQRQPDTRLHCVLGDGTVGIMIYHPQEHVLCWVKWETDGYVERAMVLPGVEEDAVYYHVRRTINGVTRRYLEKWALGSECTGDTGLNWIMDCAASYTDTGRTSTLTGYSHLAGESVVVWADDTGQTNAGKDLSPDVSGVQTTYTVDTGSGEITLSEDIHHAVAGMPYIADWKSSKLSYAAQAGTALAQMKRVPQMGLLIYNTHNNGLFFGGDTGSLDALPRVIDGKTVDPDEIHETLDNIAVPFPGDHQTDARVVLRAKAPRPVTIIAAVPTVATSERV